MSWRDTIEEEVVNPNDESNDIPISSWRDTIHNSLEEGITVPSEPTQLESGLRAAVQGTTAGWGDELGARTLVLPETIRQRLSQYLPGSPENVDKQLREQGFTGDIQQPSVLENYRQLRDTSREADKAAREANPWTYALSEIAGASLPAALVGVPASLAGTVALGTGYGALQGLGTSEADLTKGEIEQAAIDTAIGGGMGAAIPLMGSAAKGGLKYLGSNLSKRGERLVDRSSEGTKELLVTFKNAMKGIETLGKKAGDVADKKIMAIARGISNKINNTKKQANKMIAEGLEGRKIDLTDNIVKQYNNLDNLIKQSTIDVDSTKILNTAKGAFDNFMGATNINKTNISKEIKSAILPLGAIPKSSKPSYQASPQDFFNLHDKLESIANAARKNDLTKHLAPQISEMSNKVKSGVLSSIDESSAALVEQGFQTWADIRTIQQTLAEGLGDSMMSRSAPAQESLKNILSKLTGLSTSKSRGSHQEIDRGLKSLEKLYPKEMPGILKKAEEQARIGNISRKAQAAKEEVTKAGMVQSFGLKAADKAGEAVGLLKYVIDLPSSAYTRLKNSTTNPKLKQFYSNMENKTAQEKSALMFAAMQNAPMKKMILDEMGLVSSSNNEDITQD